MSPKNAIKGRGAQLNVPNRFFELSHEMRDDFLEYCQKEGEQADKNKTRYIEVFPKTISAINLNAAAATEIIKTNVSFSFRYWTNIDQKQEAPDIMGRIFETVINSAERNISRNIPRILNRL